MELKYPSPKPPPKTLSKTAFLPPATILHLKDGGWSAQDKEQDKEPIHCCPHSKAGWCTNGCCISYNTNLYFKSHPGVAYVHTNTTNYKLVINKVIN
jgi:hypothetical protein